MAARAGLEVDTLTIRIPMRLQRRGGRKLIMTPEGATAAPAPKPRRDETLIKALVRAHRWRRRIENGQVKSITDLAEQEGRHRRLRVPAVAAHLPGAGHRRGIPRWAAAEGTQAGGDAGERAAGVGTAAKQLGRLSLTAERSRRSSKLFSIDGNKRLISIPPVDAPCARVAGCRLAGRTRPAACRR
jgi:hypothetical protein